MKRFVLISLLLSMLVPGLVTLGDHVSCTLDLNQIRTLLSDAETAAAGDDGDAALQLLADARGSLASLERRCQLATTAESDEFTAMIGAIDPAILERTPTCSYRFDATVRDGSNAGVNLRGTLTLMQYHEGYGLGLVRPDAEGVDPVLVSAEFGADRAVTLTFRLPDEASIVGAGFMDSPVAACWGVMEGGFTGPAADDEGDWLGAVSTPDVGDLCAEDTEVYCLQQVGSASFDTAPIVQDIETEWYQCSRRVGQCQPAPFQG